MRIKNGSVTLLPTQFVYSIKLPDFKKLYIQFVKIARFKTDGILHSFISMVQDRKVANENLVSSGSHSGKPRFSFNKSSGVWKKAIYLILALLLLTVAYKFIRRNPATLGDSIQTEVTDAKATKDLNKEFTFPLKNDKGEKVSEVKYLIEKAELRNEIIVKGQRATAVKGRVFLILTLKITNSYNGSIQINTKDYVRLAVNGAEDEWLAPDIHNDPVEIQPISTKYTRIGYAINDSDKNLVLRVGDINGEKETFPLEF